MTAAPRVIVMGVSGSGKSTIGALLAGALGVVFVDGDALHPPENVRKMANGVPLDDDDREPWLRAVGEALADAPGGLVVACSALRHRYRDLIRSYCGSVVVVELAGSRALLAARLGARSDHFMPASLLDSQLRTFEPLAADELGGRVDIGRPVPEVLAAALALVEAGESVATSVCRRKLNP